MFVALGISIEVAANLVPTAGEGLVLAAGFIFLGRLEGVREGTVAAALLVGQVSKIFSRYLVGLRKKLGTEVD